MGGKNLKNASITSSTQSQKKKTNWVVSVKLTRRCAVSSALMRVGGNEFNQLPVTTWLLAISDRTFKTQSTSSPSQPSNGFIAIKILKFMTLLTIAFKQFRDFAFC